MGQRTGTDRWGGLYARCGKKQPLFWQFPHTPSILFLPNCIKVWLINEILSSE
nr:MAG TPA: hypothetical protein [Caudoviricetes sp.]